MRSAGIVGGRRTRAVGIKTVVGNHTFRATAVYRLLLMNFYFPGSALLNGRRISPAPNKTRIRRDPSYWPRSFANAKREGRPNERAASGRAMRYAARYKLGSEPLEQFVKRKGGINKCVACFTRRLGRGAVIEFKRCPGKG